MISFGFRSFATTITLLSTLGGTLAYAAPVPPATYIFDFTTGGVETTTADPNNIGNSWAYSDATTQQSVTVTAWSDLGDGLLTKATAVQTANGIGVCNSAEQPIAACTTSAKDRNAGNAGQQDWFLLTFEETVNFSMLTIFPDFDEPAPGKKTKAEGRDVTYFTGWITDSSQLLNASYTDLTSSPYIGGFGLRQFDVDNGKDTVAATMDLTTINGNQEVWGNAILIGASLVNGGDRILLNGITTVVPVPPALWLFGSALMALLARRKLSA